jgi:hypothetical protein
MLLAHGLGFSFDMIDAFPKLAASVIVVLPGSFLVLRGVVLWRDRRRILKEKEAERTRRLQ